MKKFFIVILILTGIILFQSEIRQFAVNLTDYIEVEILKKDDMEADGNFFNNIFNNIGINNQNNGNNKNTKEESSSNSTTTQSYDNYESIQLGEALDSLISKMGQPNKIEGSEYGFKWYIYNQDYSKFCMVGISDDEVVALFSNTMDSIESEGIELGQTKSQLLNNYKPLEYRSIGNTRYIINEDYYSLVEGNTSYITAFYDSFEDDKVVGVQIISKKIEKRMTGIYTKDTSVTDDFENINRYLVNSERVAHNLNTLSYSEKATLCARSHSEDMRDNNYFAHENLKNQSPFDRMDKYGIFYTRAAENIAAGQTSPIFAHYALMNSKGHRVNILGDYKYLGVGVAFGGIMNLYLTQNFYSI